jgi:hypothetical protein
MSPNQLFWVVASILLLPTIPVAWAWWALTSTRRAQWFPGLLLALIVQTLSLAVIFATLINSQSIGADYSHKRYAIIWTMFVASGLTAIAAKPETRLRTPLAVAALCLTVDWLYCAAVSSVV